MVNKQEIPNTSIATSSTPYLRLPRGSQNLHTDTDDYLIFARYILIKNEETERNVISGS